MKGVSAIIAIILILMIVVALAALAYTWFTGIFTTLTGTAETAVGTTTGAMATNFAVESARNVSLDTAEVTIRNIGTQTIDLNQVSAYVNDEYCDTDLSAVTTTSLGKGVVETFNVTNIPDPCGVLRLTAQTGLEKTKKISC